MKIRTRTAIVAAALMLVCGAGAPAASASPNFGCTAPALKYSWSSSLFEYCSDFGRYAHIYSGIWNAQGNPAPRTVGWIPNSWICKYGSNPALYLFDPDGASHHLTVSQWAATGNRAYRQC